MDRDLRSAFLEQEVNPEEKPLQLPKGIDRPRIPRSFAARPRGPEEFRWMASPEIAGGPGDPPDGFVGATNSRSEWWVYWALFRILARDADPRMPPFVGTPDPDGFMYQQPYETGRAYAGGSVIDFVVHPRTDPLLIRLQTEYWHVFAPAKKQALDELQKARLGKYGRVADIFEQWFIQDKTGAACIEVCQRAIRGDDMLSPLQSGQASRITRMK